MSRFWVRVSGSVLGAVVSLVAPTLAMASGSGHDDGGWSADREELRPVPIPFRTMHDRTGDGVVVYVNGEGVRVSPGADDPERGTSSLAWDADRGTVTVPGFAGGAAKWSALMECVREEYSAFSITITDKRPGSGDYIMLVVGGRSDLFGLDRGVAGSASYTGGVLPNGIGYAFEKNHGGDQRLLCETVAHEIGHTLGLDHEYLCEDLMSYLRGCGEKHFVNEEAACGEFKARGCHPGEPEQNTWEHLSEVLGTVDGAVPPAIKIGRHGDRDPGRGGDDGRGDDGDDDGSARPRHHGDDGDGGSGRGDDGRGGGGGYSSDDDSDSPRHHGDDGDDDGSYRPRHGGDDGGDDGGYSDDDGSYRPRHHGDDGDSDGEGACISGSQYGCEGARHAMETEGVGDSYGSDDDAPAARPGRHDRGSHGTRDLGPRASGDDAPVGADDLAPKPGLTDLVRFFWSMIGASSRG
jgi:hypothetical protein